MTTTTWDVPLPVRRSAPTGPWARAAVLLLEASAVAAAVDFAAAWFRVSQLGGVVVRSHVTRADRISKIAAFTGVALLVATAGVFLTWIYRAVRDRRRAGGANGLAPFAAVVLWVVPLVSLIGAPMVLAELVPSGRPRKAAMIAGWWLLWIVGGAVGVSTLHHPATIGGFRSADEHRMFSDGCRLIAALVMAAVVRSVPSAD